MPKSIIKFGYPPKEYYFTGDYSKQTIGWYKATRNKKTVYVPIYKSTDDEIISDMTQMVPTS